jgi:hypothetical protein
VLVAQISNIFEHGIPLYVVHSIEVFYSGSLRTINVSSNHYNLAADLSMSPKLFHIETAVKYRD